MRSAVLLVAVLLGALARAQTPADFPPAISVTGEAQISVAPDIAFVDAGVATDAKTAREASEANNTAMAKVFAALKAANAVFGVSYGLEIPLYFAPDGESPLEIPTLRRSNAYSQVRGECKAARHAVGPLSPAVRLTHRPCRP